MHRLATTVRPALLSFSALLALAAVAEAASPPAWESARRLRMEYRAELKSLDVAEDARLRIWIPLPSAGQAQQVDDLEVRSPWKHRVETDLLGNRILYLEGRGSPGEDVEVSFTSERRPHAGIPAGEAAASRLDDPQRYLDAPRLIPLQGLIQETADRVAKGLESRSDKAWAFYDYVYRTMRYDKSGTGWGRGDAIWACTNERGNCTDFHSLFMGMALSHEIPARFLIGFPVPDGTDSGTIGGYHCWAEFYDERRGWLPVDASEARKSGQKVAYFGVLPNDRVRFTLGRDLVLTPAQDGPPLNYFIDPYVEVDGEPMKVGSSVRFESLDGVARAEPAGS